MIGLGLRLAVSGGREAVVRLVILAVAVGLGVGLLLTALSAINAVNAQNARHAWLWTGTSIEPAGHAPAGTDPLWWSTSADNFGGRLVVRVDVAATGPTAPVPPGIPHDPAPGQYYASPALASLLRSTPADELAVRYPGRLAGPIGDAALPSPDSLYIIIGHTAAQMARTPDSIAVTTIATSLPGSREGERNPKGLHTIPPDDGIGASGIDLILAVVVLALLTPVLIFIATATRLSAARRELRFAAMRLVGARPRQVSVLAAVESTVAAAAGVAAGFGLFFVLRIPLSGIPFTGKPFFPADLSLSLPDILVVAIGVPAAAALVARLALRRVHISPLGVTRRVTPRPPRAWRALPLLAGLAWLGFFVVHGRPATVPGQIQAFVPGCLVILIGLVIAGPWLTMAGARIMARRTSRPGALIAARRLADDPRAGFRAVSGLVLALFITTVAVADITTQDAKDLHPRGWASAANVLVDDLAGQPLPTQGRRTTQRGPLLTAPGSARTLAPLLARLSRIHGVEGVIAVRAGGRPTLPVALLGASTPGIPSGFQLQGPVAAGVVSCSQLARAPGLGRCPAGAAAVSFPEFLDAGAPGKSLETITWPAEDVPARQLAGLGLDSIDIPTDGSQSAIEQARTALENANAYPSLGTPTTLAEQTADLKTTNNAYQQLADVVILASLAIAGCTLAASVAAGLADRKRPFSLLRLTGARLGLLRRVVALESAVPLLAVAAVSIGVGFGASAMFVSVQEQHPLVAPGAAYYLITAAGIAASLAIIAATFPLLRRITGPEVARNE
ncbi:MAG TPA: FtsX-like permease family protein [Streptosporangiaceae bacterium]|nr:FtsX-like permease family protein [Streptosporangiaceae bacterium]